MLSGYVGKLLSASLQNNVKLNWEEDIYSGEHPNAEVLEETWDDEDEYKKWSHDTRGE